MSKTYLSANMTRVPWLDAARGFTIILVVMMHSTFGVTAILPGDNFMKAIVDFAQPFRIPAFFFLSGLLLPRSINKPWRLYLDSRVLHFVYFYMLWLTIQFAFKAPYFATEFGWKETVALYFVSYVQPFGTLWFIYLLPIFFIITRALRNFSPYLILPFLAALEILPFITGSIIIDEFCSRFIYFYTGYVFASFIFEFVHRLKDQKLLVGVFLLLWLLANALCVVMGFSTLPFMSLYLGFLGTLSLIMLASFLSQSLWSSPFEFCGRNSLVIYLAFFFPMAAMRTLLMKTGLTENAGVVSLIVTIFAVTIPLLLDAATRKFGKGRFLFKRPHWARLKTV